MNDGEEGVDSRILVAITLIILFVFWGIVIYLAIRSPSVNPGTQVLANCPTEQCATNIFSGQKRCPPPTGTIVADLGLEVCNPPNLCRNRLTPYAIQFDGSTNLQGLCQPGVQCRCVSSPTCANYITTIFETIEGNPYVSVTGQRTTWHNGCRQIG